MKRSIILVIALLLIGCVSSPEERSQKQSEYEIAQCSEIGFKQGTEAFGSCRLKLREIAENKKAAVAAAIIGANGSLRPRTCTGYGNSVTCY